MTLAPAPTDIVEHHRLRRHARLATLAFLLVGARLCYVLLVLVRGPSKPFAMVPFLGLAVLAAIAWPVLGRLWRRSAAHRPVTLSINPGPGELRGVPELDEPSGPHISLSGRVDPPTRW